MGVCTETAQVSDVESDWCVLGAQLAIERKEEAKIKIILMVDEILLDKPSYSKKCNVLTEV